MKVSTKLRLSSLLVVVLITLFIGGISSLFIILDQAQQKEQLAQKITETSFQLALLRSEYVEYNIARSKTQWITVYETQARLFEEAASLFTSGEEVALFEDAHKLSLESRVLFGELVQTIDEGGSKTVAEELSNQLTIKAQAQVAHILSFSEISRAQAVSKERMFEVLIAVLGVLIITLSLWSYIVSRSIVGSLNALSQGTEIIASGNLEYRLSITSGDEFQTLGELFNKMAERLKEAQSSLEQRVTDRTRLLNEKVNELEGVKKATLNLLQDLETEQKNIAGAKAKDEAILSSIGDGFIVTDNAGKIVFINKAFEHMLYWKEGEVLGKYLSDVIPSVDGGGNPIPLIERPVSIALTKHTIASSSNAFYKRKDGTMFPVSVVVSPIIIRGELTGAVELFRDITKEKEIDKAKTEFVSLASHQLRTPLTSINWYTEMLLAGDAGVISPEQKKYLEEIYTGNQRMVDLVNSLLNASRLELGTFTVDSVPTDIKQIAEKVVQELEPDVFKRKLELTEEYDKELPLINADPKLLRMVIQNLLSNAVKYTPEKGTINFSITKNENEFLITVKDTGYGIRKEQQNKIFTKMFRADNVREKDAEGTGLGLYIVKAVVEHSGGKIWFESEEDVGTTFHVTLPLSGMRKREGTKSLS